MPTDDLARHCCQNPQCPRHGQRGAGNLSVCGHFGKRNHRLLYCKACKARFSEFKGTPYFNAKLPHDQVTGVLEHLADGCGTRQTARLVRVCKDTVTRLALLAGEHAKDTHNELVAFSPATREVQFDEKWAFVAKKQKNCDPTDPDDAHCGDYWDHVAFDPEHKLVLVVIPGARSIENAEITVMETKARLGDEAPFLTSDEYAAYATAIETTFGVPVPSPPQRGPGRPRVAPEMQLPAGMCYATVHKHRENGRVVTVKQKQVFGTPDDLEEALGRSSASHVVNTSFVERQHATDRGRNARKSRKTYRFSKDWEVHEAVTYLTMYGYNFCWCVRTLRVKDEDGRWRERTPAMSAGLTDHVWTWREWFMRPAVQSS